MFRWTTTICAVAVILLSVASCVGNHAAKDQVNNTNYELGAGGLPIVPRDASDEPSSGAPAELAIAGASAEVMQNGLVDGGSLVLSSTASELGYGLYKVTGLAGHKVTKLAINVATSGADAKYSIGVSNYSDGAWDFVGTSSYSTYEYDFSSEMSALISQGGSFYFLVVVSGGSGATVEGATLFSRPMEPGEVQKPYAAGGFFVSEGLPSSIVVEWNPVEGAESYELYRHVISPATDGGDNHDGDNHDGGDTTGDGQGDGGGEQAAVPGEPGHITTSRGLPDSITLDWGAVERATSYSIERRTFDLVNGVPTFGDWADVGTSEAPNYTDAAVETGIALQYRVRGVNADGAGPYSGTEIGYAGDQPAWMAEDKGASSWNEGGEWVLIATLGAAENRYEDTDVTEGNVYQYRLAGVNSAGSGATTRTEDGYVGTAPVLGNWNDDQDDETDEGHDSGDMQPGGDDHHGDTTGDGGDSTGGDATGGDTGADNGGGDTTGGDTGGDNGGGDTTGDDTGGDNGDASGGDTGGDTGGDQVELPGVPSHITTSRGLPDSITLSWGSAERASSYVIERRSFGMANGAPTFGEWAEAGTSDDAEYVDTAVEGAQAYQYRVRGVNAGGQGDYSGTEIGYAGDKPAWMS